MNIITTSESIKSSFETQSGDFKVDGTKETTKDGEMMNLTGNVALVIKDGHQNIGSFTYNKTHVNMSFHSFSDRYQEAISLVADVLRKILEPTGKK